MNELFLHSLAFGSIAGLLANCFLTISRVSHLVHFGLWGCLLIGAYVGSFSLIGALFITGALNGLFYTIAIKPLPAPEVSTKGLLLSILFLFFIQGFLLLLFGGEALPQTSIERFVIPRWGWWALVIFGLTGAWTIITKYHMLGTQLEAMADNTAMANGLGINTNKIETLLWVFTGAGAGLAGYMLLHESAISITSGLATVVIAIAATAPFKKLNPIGALLLSIAIVMVQSYLVFNGIIAFQFTELVPFLVLFISLFITKKWHII